MLTRQIRLFATTAIVALMAISGGSVAAQGDGAFLAFAPLQDVDGTDVGLVRWTGTDRGVEVEVSVEGLPAGFHGFHVHAVGECIAPFTSAGGHLDLDGADHPGHAGDMPALLVNADGTGEAHFVTDRYVINDLFGAGVIIHAGPDNKANIPDRYAADGPDEATLATGDAGGRIACGMIAVPKPATQ